MNNLCTCSAIVLLQDLMPLVSSKDIHPGTRLTQYYQSWWLGHEIALTAQRNTVGHKKGFPKRPLIFFHPKPGRSSTIGQLYGGWFSQERRSETKFLYQRVEAHSTTTGRPYPHKWWDTLIAPLCKDSPMWIVLSHHWLYKNRGDRSSQMGLMITTNRQFLWKHNTVEYL